MTLTELYRYSNYKGCVFPLVQYQLPLIDHQLYLTLRSTELKFSVPGSHSFSTQTEVTVFRDLTEIISDIVPM